ncbi:hypothetical protein BA895_13940 [Humibacillus sp. DSM 29435]|uniref:GGDEF domain-containing protein n=1 Tax=Humibacillus sp. DSM 29435 TaxID=1869167 RepID=UPI000871B9D4|nr:GGDEF domain-containing protein [Humibacillus sp. DSM 29435]OFE17885.1 hypothetical protein BA895_13940 [Humibacillus sp. DSM 29435]
MELDKATLHLSFGVVAATMLVLFYFVVFRTTRSPYSGWWCATLTFYLIGAGVRILDDALQHFWALPVSNMLIVLGASSAWAAARSLNGAASRWWQLTAAAALIGIASLVDHRTTDVSAGGLVFLAMMPVISGLTARELWRMDHRRTGTRTSLAIAATVISAYHAARCAAFIIDGTGGDATSRYFGYEVTSIFGLVFLVVVSFSMSMLSTEQTTKELQIRATQDGLTGMLNRAEFLRLATRATRPMGHGDANAALILADLDNFKEINDTHGHQAGDRVLQEFAQVAKRTVRSSDLVGRYGGEEFMLLLPHTGLDRAEQVTVEISSMLSALDQKVGFRMPTVSYGLTSLAPGASLEAAIASADVALYRAKTLGRDRAVRD